jgi:hypothetical protein
MKYLFVLAEQRKSMLQIERKFLILLLNFQFSFSFLFFLFLSCLSFSFLFFLFLSCLSFSFLFFSLTFLVYFDFCTLSSVIYLVHYSEKERERKKNTKKVIYTIVCQNLLCTNRKKTSSKSLYWSSLFQ